ncbi:hypothetical protein L6452_32257 [Arctium lappa]|uniref:Uncharacterized protein n=1 Tax=Arctium lappa TaxID=4217 RepID=A0ACB8Z4Y7_ARCLA|nr:hypothetical protein L6452_32257 [Arctium lappa]
MSSLEMDASNWGPTPGGNAGGGDSSIESGDWRSKLQADSREMILNNIVGTLKRLVPFSGHEGLQELKKIAMRFEEKIYTAATSQSDYLQKISLKMLTMETGSQNSMPDARQSNSAANSVNPSDPGTMTHNLNQGIDHVVDNALIHPDQFLPLTPNNFHLDIEALKCQHEVVVEILRGHPIYYALTATAEVPRLYLQQFWRSLTHIREEGENRLESRIDGMHIVITRELFRQILRLPTANSVPGRDSFDPPVSEATLCAEIQSLGYSADLPQTSSFNRRHLTPLWYTFFTILNRCLSSITKGIDQCSANLLRLFHGVAFYRHIDYTAILWYELDQKVRDNAGNRRRNFIPFMRFLQLIIRHYMELHPTIARRSTHTDMDTSNWRPTPGGSVVGGDWRSKLQADSRERILNNILLQLELYVGISKILC